MSESPPREHHSVLDPEELEFLKSQTRITDEEELKTHVLAMQKKAVEVYPYPCIKRFGFIRLKIVKNKTAYEHVLDLGRNVPGALLLDIGCCFGNDLRKIASDGFPAENLIASDLRQEFWDLGHELFRSTPESFPATFVPGDVFDPDFLQLCTPLTDELPDPAVPDLRSLGNSLNPLRGRISAIHTASLFHLFGQVKQLELASKLTGLLSPRSGSIIFGCHGGQPTKGYTAGSRGKQMFCHSPESWREMWQGVFEQGTVEVQVTLRNVGKVLNPTTDFHMMFWSVKRL
ncbi:hypothetical protein FB45DRAFT_819649 [Roridomyces roridus]|uniref:Methyltransferase domain-containing protein n=1 Tax=Roridomyces roridus TaxID=1738132 RepID=A0AAD7CJ90_9AGAR|nr:hypothetical protein FB45DRAFT_819649 [Roridomyces roridus]